MRKRARSSSFDNLDREHDDLVDIPTELSSQLKNVSSLGDQRTQKGNLISKFSNEGNNITKFGSSGSGLISKFSSGEGNNITKFGSGGSGHTNNTNYDSDA
eukprot:Pgem_evm1s15785